METPLTPRQLLTLKARLDLVTFNRCVYPPYLHAPHLELISSALMQVECFIATQGQEGIGKLRVELAPRHGKSQLVARLFPAWLLGRLPNARIILASHTASLSESHSRWVRNVIKSATYQSIFAKTRLSDDSQARDNWDLAEPHQGGMFAVGVGGAVHGRGGQCLIADDLIASREAYESKSQRDKLWQWFTDDLGSRKEPHAAQIIISTRWGQDDPSGRLELSEPGEWHVIKLPALAEENDPLGRKPGQPLWPVRFDKPALEAQRRSMGEYSFAALYQQNPQAASGGIFKRDKFQIIDSAPTNIKRVVRFWDLAISEKQNADYTVGVKLAVTEDGRYIVLDVQRWQKGWKDTKDGIIETAQSDGPDVSIGIETVQFQAVAVIELLQRPELHDFSIVGYPVHKDKTTRALPAAARVDAGLFYLLRAGWNQDYIDELSAFNKAKHDDQVDGTSGAYTMIGTLQTSPVFEHVEPTPAADYRSETIPLIEWSVIDSSLPGAEPQVERCILIYQKNDAQTALNIFAEYFAPPDEPHDTSISNALALGYDAPHLTYYNKGAAVLRLLLLNRGLMFSAPDYSLDQGIINANRLIAAGVIRIHPRCTNLLEALNNLRLDEKGKLDPTYQQGPLALIQAAWPLRYSVIDAQASMERK